LTIKFTRHTCVVRRWFVPSPFGSGQAANHLRLRHKCTVQFYGPHSCSSREWSVVSGQWSEAFSDH